MKSNSNLERILATARSTVNCKRILLAEDNPADVYLIREALAAEQMGDRIQLEVVSDGEQAIDYVLRRGAYVDAPRPDLVILDLNLPKSDGVDVLRCARKQPGLANVPIIVLTSSDSPADRTAIENLGANNFITKPSDLDAFMALGGTLLSYVRAKSSSRTTT
jgi:two-component system response regulator